MRVFTSTPGTVVVYRRERALPGAIRLVGGSFGPIVIFTRVGFRQQVNVQLQQSLRNSVFVYNFGDLVGDVALSGMTFAASCVGIGNRLSGLEQILDFYSRRKVSASGQGIEVRIGTTPLLGFLVGAEAGVSDANTRAGEFAFRITTLPPLRDVPAGVLPRLDNIAPPPPGDVLADAGGGGGGGGGVAGPTPVVTAPIAGPLQGAVQ